MTAPVQHRISFIQFRTNVLICTCEVRMASTPEAFRNHRMEMRAGPAITDVAHSHTPGASKHPRQVNVNRPSQPALRGAPPQHRP